MRLPCPPLSPRVYSSSCQLSRWCSLTISSFAALFFCLQSFSASECFPISGLLASSGQSIGASALASFSIFFSNEYSGYISLRIDWFDVLAVQGTLQSLLQHHNLKASILQHSAFIMIQLSHPYMTNGKTIWLYGPLSAKWSLCLLIRSLGPCCL